MCLFPECYAALKLSEHIYFLYLQQFHRENRAIFLRIIFFNRCCKNSKLNKCFKITWYNFNMKADVLMFRYIIGFTALVAISSPFVKIRHHWFSQRKIYPRVFDCYYKHKSYNSRHLYNRFYNTLFTIRW